MIRSITAYRKGSVCLMITGEHPERFINFCLTADIYLWGVKKKEKQLHVWIYLSDFKKIRSVVQKSKVKIKVVERYGMPFLLKKLKRRKTLLMGAVVFFLTIYWLSGYLLFVEVQGLKKISRTEVADMLTETGFKFGARLDEIDEKALEKKIMDTFPAVAWVGVRFTGTKGIIEIVEKADTVGTKQNQGDLIASKSGVITECIVLTGERVIAVGDAVREGDVLVKGVRRSESEAAAGAEGIVKARVFYENYGEAPLKKYLYERTGKFDFAVKLLLNDRCIRIKDVNTTDFAAYEIEHRLKREDDWRNSRFPVELIIDVYHELNVDVKEFAPEEAKKIATMNALNASSGVVPEDARVLNREPILVESGDENLIKVVVKIETEEEIGQHIKYSKD